VTRSVPVEIAGQRFSLRTDAKPKYVKELAAFVTRKIEEARKTGKIATTQSLALLAAMTIADELFQERQQRRELQREVRETSQRILRYLDQEAGLL
jgi:cell division protein ZapA (FtsZ GTPase activity inhibitor)